MGDITQASPEKVVYMLSSEADGRDVAGPLLGDPGVDFASLADAFRSERYAKAEISEEDHCWISEDDFITWLLERGVLSPFKTVSVPIRIKTDDEYRYVPKHWPQCPECGLGRGDLAMGRVLHSLNRCDWHRECTECGHAWGHHDEPYYRDKPMLEDDGRCISGGCVPYSISQAGGLPMASVLEVCARHGWQEKEGMMTESGILAARELGLRMRPRSAPAAAGKLTLRRLLDALPSEKNFIVAINGHWLALVRGENRDQADTSMRSEVVGCWEVDFGEKD